MPGPATTLVDSPEFQRAFVAMSYFWGARAEVLTHTLGAVLPLPATKTLLELLGHPARAERARALSDELGRLARALEEWGSWR